MEERDDIKNYIARPKFEEVGLMLSADQHAPVSQHHTLRTSRRAACVEDGENVVGSGRGASLWPIRGRQEGFIVTITLSKRIDEDDFAQRCD
jgi:hypothetical protein